MKNLNHVHETYFFAINLKKRIRFYQSLKTHPFPFRGENMVSIWFN